jgi:hypothetical protein
MTSDTERAVLDGVPKVAFAPIHDGKFEFTPFPSCLKSVCGFLGRKLPYHYLLGASGAAFRLVWHSKRWEGGNVDIVFMAQDPFEPHRRALAAAGARGDILLNASAAWDFDRAHEARKRYLEPLFGAEESRFRSRIIASIDRGIPVIAFGVVGPPEASIITGYDDGGDTLIGWSMFQDHLDPTHDLSVGDADEMNPPTGMEESGYFRRSDWFRSTHGILTFELGPEADRDAVYRSALRWIPAIIRGPAVYEFHTGLAAYDAYLEKLADDAEYPAGNMEVLAERKMVHYDAMTMIAERDAGSRFLSDVAGSSGFAPARKALEAAAESCKAANAEMGAWWKIVGKIWNDEEAQIRAVGDPEIRRRWIPHVQAARRKDEETLGHIEEALSLLGP